MADVTAADCSVTEDFGNSLAAGPNLVADGQLRVASERPDQLPPAPSVTCANGFL
ncbi:MAG: hypothetical protein ACRDRR_13615 [Pseudonocardiaceae bacterium]